jgi:poly(ribitol-phosphate) beta-N-acetylglucosaminyltransferase
MKFSIIIPAYNAEATIRRAIDSALRQDEAEVIVVDDRSTDRTLRLAEAYGSTVCVAKAYNEGPGTARNRGLEEASGDWVVFLDADDELIPGALKQLWAFIEQQPADLDLVGFNWHDGGGAGMRRDGRWLNAPKQDLLNAYVALRMDGAVTFTAIRREALGGLRFRAGYHEDVDYLYKVYATARRTAYFDNICYVKHGSGITGTVTEKHIDGFIEAWTCVLEESLETFDAIERGIIGVVATRVREIVLKTPTTQISHLLSYLFHSVPTYWKELCRATGLRTQYAEIARMLAETNSVDASLFSKKWSCKDLQHSAYLGPDQVRACCKRFFVDGERRGDVVLIDNIHERMGRSGTGVAFLDNALNEHTIPFTTVTAATIAEAKRDLIERNNTGEETPCTGCPWLEFKEWGEPEISYLSLEHHSVCNMRCTYCSPKYYEGKRPSYDVQKLVSGLAPGVRQVVWGGGEPTLGGEFTSLSRKLALAGVHQRILSNSVIYSSDVHHLLIDGKAELVTSIDAGTPELFKRIRGVDKLFSVLNTLFTYARQRPDLVTVKYILTEENCASEELAAFVKNVQVYGLLLCNFQISCDFRQEVATPDELHAVVELHYLLRGAGVACVFVDDLCRLRIKGLYRPGILQGALRLAVVHSAEHLRVLAWGSGEQCRRLVEDTLFFRHVEYDVTDSDAYNPADDPRLPIVIAASQSYPAIYRELKQRGLEHRIIKELIL